MKFFGYQILAIGVIWLGMTIFFSKMDQLSTYIYYGVTSWLLFLIVLFVKQYLRQRK
ncbi:hypothetical protein [Virgibacillus siamensis]|uniref:hypothetical protein n=1 Tax=Virgibacillus siamensis TaxID=480071 RepID=UPI00158B7A69|nr:hypothetical protein [Virgibacillus siamensis]